MSSGFQDETGREWAGFCPPEPPALEPWLAQVLEVGGEVTGLDGLLVPRIREPTLDLEVIRMATTKAVQSPNKHPGGNARLCIESSFMVRVEGKPAAEVNAYLGLTDRGQIMRYSPDGPVVYYRSLQRLVRKGDKLWSELGGWPWAAYEAGTLPAKWREDPRLATELARWHQRAIHQARERLLRQNRRLTRAHAFRAEASEDPPPADGGA